MNKIKIAIVDTMFARTNMGNIAIDELKNNFSEAEYIRKTVPGFKDLAVECKNLLTNSNCDIAIAFGMGGGSKIDVQCAHEASLAIQQAKLMTGKHIIEVFIFETESWSETELIKITNNRIRKHVHNAVNLIQNPQWLINQAGKGIRQGFSDEGEWEARKKKVKFSFVVGEFEKEITDKMVEIAKNTCEQNNILIGQIIKVPGCYDIPIAVKKLLLDKSNNAIIALGAVIKGETKHDEIITISTSNRLSELSLEFNRPITLGIVGPGATIKQVESRKEEYAKRAVLAAIKLVEDLE